jgi:hypothetical protein
MAKIETLPEAVLQLYTVFSPYPAPSVHRSLS